MAFKSAFIYMAPDANPEVHRAKIKTSTLEFTVVVIQFQNFDQAVDVSKSLVQSDGVQNIILCPGFTHEAVAKIKETVGANVSVAVARADTPNNMLAIEILTKEGWFPKNN